MANRDANWSGDVLERIVALLFALADLADLAACAPVHRRQQVLGILSYGEAEARAFLIGMPPGAPIPDALESAGDAAHLAGRLRALALLLCAMLAQRFALPGATGPEANQRMPAERAACHAAPPAAPDTS